MLNPNFVSKTYHSDEARTDRVIQAFSDDLAKNLHDSFLDEEAEHTINITKVELKESFLRIINYSWFNTQIETNINMVLKFLNYETDELEIHFSLYELVNPLQIEFKRIYHHSSFYDYVIDKLFNQFIELSELSNLNNSNADSFPYSEFRQNDICKNWFSENYENTVDEVAEYLTDNQKQLYIFWDFTQCSNEIVSHVKKLITTETISLELHTLLIEEILVETFDKEPLNPIMMDLIVESLILSNGHNWAQIQTQRIFDDMNRFLILREDDYYIDIVILSNKELFRSVLNENSVNNLSLESIDLIVESLSNNVKKSPSELLDKLNQLDYNSQEIMVLLDYVALEGLVLVDSLEQNDELISYLNFAQDSVVNGYKYNLLETYNNQNLLRESLNIFYQVKSRTNLIVAGIFFILLVNFFVLRSLKYCSDQMMKLLVFILAVLLCTLLFAVSMWDFVFLNMFQNLKVVFGNNLISPIGLEFTFQVFVKEIFDVVLIGFKEFHNRILLELSFLIVFVSLLVVLRKTFTPFRLVRIFSKCFH
tara:strand:+ start:18480 stop:20090 length:1611 start_codon:yes stop_codon:yes gene_type:complete